MKKLLLLLLLTGSVTGGLHAQEKQRKVLLQQIAALKIYIGYAQKGYSIAKKGLNAIGDLKRGELNLHADYLSSLQKVSPEIKKYGRIAEIMVLQLKIIENYKRTCAHLKQGDLFHGNEMAYIKRVFDRLLDDCRNTLDELIAVTMDGRLEMKDDERMQRIDGLYYAMADNYSFCQRFNNETKVLYLLRTKENREVQTGRALNSILND